MKLHEVMIKSLTNALILDLVIDSNFEHKKVQVWVYACSNETYVNALRVLWD